MKTEPLCRVNTKSVAFWLRFSASSHLSSRVGNIISNSFASLTREIFQYSKINTRMTISKKNHIVYRLGLAQIDNLRVLLQP